MKVRCLILLTLIACSGMTIQAQAKPKAQGRPITTQTATSSEGRAVILKSDGTWIYEPSESTGNLATFTGKCRFQLVAGFFPCNPKVLFLSRPNDVSHVTFVKVESGKEITFTLSGRADRQPNLENYYLQIDTLSMDGVRESVASDDGMEGECHFRMNKTATNFFSVKCDVYNRSKGSIYNFYLENITKTVRKVLY